jgi:hypothetical protein
LHTNSPPCDGVFLTELQCTTPAPSIVNVCDQLRCPPTPQLYGTYFVVDIPCEKALMMPLL